jgi:L-ascorbate metabolism protein UlaG (beta-lactamase superfamily)
MANNDIARRLACRVMPALVVLTLYVSAQAQVTVTHVANAGFLLEGGGKKVLIDALFDEGARGYPRIPKDTIKLLRAAEAPFDDVDLVLLTHTHMDHFGPRTLTRHMRANPHATLVCPPQAREALERHIQNHAGIAERIVTLNPEEGETIQGTYGGIDVQVLNLHHGRDTEPPITNLAFLLELGGMAVLHAGDTEALTPVFELYEFQDRRIDVALLPAWFVSYAHWAEVVNDYIRPTHIVAMHMPLPDAPGNYYGLHGSYDGRLEALKRLFPDATLMDSPGATRTFVPEKESN